MEQTSPEDEIILLKLQNHHLNTRLMDHVKIEAARTEQMARVLEENEVLRDELATLMATLESYEGAEDEDHSPQLPAAFSAGLPVRRTHSPEPSTLSRKRSMTSLGQRNSHRAPSISLQTRPMTSQGYTAPLRVRSASPSLHTDRDGPHDSFPALTSLQSNSFRFPIQNLKVACSPPLTPTLNLLPPRPAPKRATSPTQSAAPLPLDLRSVLTSLSERSCSPNPGEFDPCLASRSASSSPHPDSRPASSTSLGNPFSFTQHVLQRSPKVVQDVPSAGQRSEEHLQGLLAEFSVDVKTAEKSGPQYSYQHVQSRPQHSPFQRSMSDTQDGPIAPDYDSDSDATSEGSSASEVESIIAPRPASNRSSIYSHSKRDSNMPEPTDMIFHLTQMMRLERKEREEEKARWAEERRELHARTELASSQKSAACTCSPSPVWRREEKFETDWDESYTLPPAYDFLKPWTYPLPYQSMTHDIDQRLEKLLHQAQELAQEKRLFETLARASVDDCIDNE